MRTALQMDSTNTENKGNITTGKQVGGGLGVVTDQGPKLASRNYESLCRTKCIKTNQIPF